MMVSWATTWIHLVPVHSHAPLVLMFHSANSFSGAKSVHVCCFRFTVRLTLVTWVIELCGPKTPLTEPKCSWVSSDAVLDFNFNFSNCFALFITYDIGLIYPSWTFIVLKLRSWATISLNTPWCDSNHSFSPSKSCQTHGHTSTSRNFKALIIFFFWFFLSKVALLFPAMGTTLALDEHLSVLTWESLHFSLFCSLGRFLRAT